VIELLDASREDVLRARIGDELFTRQRSSRHACVPVGADGCFIAMRCCEVERLSRGEKGDRRVCIYCGGEDMLILGAYGRMAALLRGMDSAIQPFDALAALLDGMTADDIDVLERMERDVIELEDGLITSRVPVKGAGSRIVALSRALLRMKRYYDQLDMILDSLMALPQGVPGGARARIAGLGRRVDRLTESVAHLSECVAQAREAYQAQIDIEQNQIMKLFTVISAVFMPLTLIAGWYGMNFDIPEYGWRFGYAYVAALSLMVCALCFVMFRHKRWF
jgi:magnesium transporter